MKEQALLLGPHRSIVGVYTPAEGQVANDSKPLVLILNAGLVHHAGPQRLHVKLARRLAVAGFPSLRIDQSGIGDSASRPDNIPAQELVVREPSEIMDEMALRGHKRFVLFGICSGAWGGLQIAAVDARIESLILVNQALVFEDPDTGSQASAQYYLRRSLWNPQAWINLFTGRIKYGALFQTIVREIRRRVLGGGKKQVTVAEIARGELAPALVHGAQLFLLLSDRHAQFEKLLLEGLQDLIQNKQLHIEAYPATDHLFTLLHEQELLIDRVCQWLNSRYVS